MSRLLQNVNMSRAVSDGRCSGRRRPWKVLDDDEWSWSKPIVDPPQLIVLSGKLLEHCSASGTRILGLSHLHTAIAALVMEVMEVVVVAHALCNIIIFIWKICLFYYAFWMFRLVTMMWQWLTVDLTPLTRSTDINTNKILINIYCCKGAHDQLSLSLMDGLRLIQSWVTTLSMNVVVVKT